MIVCIAEKPSVARDIARIIGANSSHEGYMEGNGYQVTWTFGHLCELKMPEDYTPMWKRWVLSSLPMIPQRFGIRLKEDQGVKKQFAVIERLMQAADGIVNCGDAGQEGELIQRWVMQKAQAKCPVQRLWISSMTDEAIREGFQKLKDQSEYQSLYMAGLSRAIGDWLLGINATRLYSIKYGQPGHPLSIGRVQTPTLALIVNRQKEIENFKPEPYWVLATVYRDTLFTATKGKFTNKEEGEKAFAIIEGKPFVVTDVQKKKGTEAPPHLYDLTSLQVDCNRKFGYSAEMTLNLIQSLYEKKFTTYPRVDTQFLSDDIYPKCGQTMNGLFQTHFAGQQPYAELVKALSGKPLKKSKKVFDTSKVTDHHAIIPTGVPPQNLSDAERNVFDLVARRFIAVFYPDCKFAQTTVVGEVGEEVPTLTTPEGTPVEKSKETVEFKVTGKEILDQGWRVVYAKDAPMENDESADAPSGTAGANAPTLPTFQKGESGPHKPTLTEKWTTQPKNNTETTHNSAIETPANKEEDETLLAALKQNGIVRLIDMIKEELLKSCELTGIWEKKLRDIEHNQYDPAQFINELKEQITAIVNQVMSDNSNRRMAITTEEDLKKKSRKVAPKKTTKAPAGPAKDVASDPLVGQPCPVCGKGHIIKGKTAYGCSEWKSGCTFRQPFESPS